MGRISLMSSSEISAWRESAQLAGDFEECIRRCDVEQQRLLEANQRHRLRLLPVLDQFYDTRVGGHRYRLMIAPSHCEFGTFRLQSVGAEATKGMDQEGQEEELHSFRTEMREFGEYLRTEQVDHHCP